MLQTEPDYFDDDLDIEEDLEWNEPNIKLCPACSVGVMLSEGITYVCMDCGHVEEDGGEDDG